MGAEFKADQGKKVVIVHVLYGLNSYGTAFHSHLADCVRSIGYTPCIGDNDLWMKPENGLDRDQYYSYIMGYIDDVLR